MVLASHRDAEQLGGADGGADALLKRRGGGRAWQVKHFPRRIEWAHCRASLDSLVESYDVADIGLQLHDHAIVGTAKPRDDVNAVVVAFPAVHVGGTERV